MGSSINEIKAAINSQGGIARPHSYEIDIGPVRGLNQGFPRNFTMLAEEIEMPGRHFMTTPQIIYGVQRKIPYGAQYSDLPVTFICTENMRERKIFEEWHSLIQNPTTNYMLYYDDYVSSVVTIKKLDAQNRIVHSLYLEEVWPVTLDSQKLSYKDTDTYLQVNVTFAFLRWRTSADYSNANDPVPTVHNIPDAFKPTEAGGQGYTPVPPKTEESKVFENAASANIQALIDSLFKKV